MTNNLKKTRQDTKAARWALDSDIQHGAVIPPLYLSSTFSYEGLDGKRRYDYTRSGNPTRDQFAEAVSALEGGAGAVITASGMAAVHLATQLLAAGDSLAAPHDCYGGSYRLFSTMAGRGLFNMQWLPLWETGQSVKEIQRLRPRMVWIETPSNPLLRISDIEAIAAAAKEVDALVVADNTFLSPVGQNPLELGADIVLHSTTKYINGHSDIVGGAVVAKDAELVEELAWWANCLGLTASPFDSFQALRGLRTLKVRYQRHEENAAAVASFLDSHPGVRKVFYPGLEGHEGHQTASRQQKSFGAMISFELETGYEGISAFLERLELFTLAASLGGVESLVAHPATMTHATMSDGEREAAGIGDGLLRLSVGIEHCEDLLADLEQGLSAL